MLRELTHEEVGFVAGGDIVVNGVPLQQTVGSSGNSALAPFLLTGYYGYIATQALIPQVQTAPNDDSEEDGEENETIVVTAVGTTYQIGNDHFAEHRGNGVFLIYKESDWWWNQADDRALGFFVRATPSEADTIINSGGSTTTSAGAQGTSGGVSGNGNIVVFTNDGVTTYWRRVG